MPDAPDTIAIIGLGLMGAAFSELLIADGHPVRGYDIDPARRETLAQLGGTPCASPAEAARGTTGVLTCLMRASIVREVLLGDDGVLSGTDKPLIIDTSTVLPDEARALAAVVRARGAAILDGPVAGSSEVTRRREALALCGGEAADLARAEKWWRPLFKTVHHLGGSGAGSAAKLAVNLVLGLNRLALAEGLVFAEAQGLDGTALLDVLKASPAYSTAMDAKGEKMLRAEYTPQARLAQHMKDVDLILQLGRQCGQELPSSTLHRALLGRAVERGHGESDNSAIIEALRQRD